eukprot:5016602-Karenia_brevis.AAC.1
MGVDQQQEVETDQDKYTADEWMAWVGAISNPVQCWVCGQMGHIGRNCPSKGLGKGGPPLGKGTPQVGDK